MLLLTILLAFLLLVSGSLCFTVINGLKGRTVYQIRMHAENRNGAGPVSVLKVLTGIPHDEGTLVQPSGLSVVYFDEKMVV